MAVTRGRSGGTQSLEPGWPAGTGDHPPIGRWNAGADLPRRGWSPRGWRRWRTRRRERLQGPDDQYRRLGRREGLHPLDVAVGHGLREIPGSADESAEVVP